MAETSEPFGDFRFLVEISGIDGAMAFTEVSGLGNETSVIEYRRGSDLRTRKIPGRHRHHNIVLKRGLTADDSLWTWRKLILDGVADRRNGSIIVLDARNEEVVRYNFYEGWPARWEGPTLNSSGGDIAVETLEIAHEGIELSP